MNKKIARSNHRVKRLIALLSIIISIGVVSLSIVTASYAESKPPQIPTIGMNTANVYAQHGEPSSRTRTVGNPPISSWSYDTFTVYFEGDHVIHSVPHNKKGLARKVEINKKYEISQPKEGDPAPVNSTKEISAPDTSNIVAPVAPVIAITVPQETLKPKPEPKQAIQIQRPLDSEASLEKWAKESPKPWENVPITDKHPDINYNTWRERATSAAIPPETQNTTPQNKKPRTPKERKPEAIQAEDKSKAPQNTASKTQ